MRINQLGNAVVALVAAVLVAGAGAGCGGSANDQEAGDTQDGGNSGLTVSGTKNPCQLVSEVDLGSIVGTTVERVDEREEALGRICEWRYSRAGATDATIAVSAWHGKRFYTPDALPAGFTQVAGIGDVAHTGNGLFMFRKGEDVITVIIIGDPASSDLEPKIAKLVAEKL
jgi:hypothetical protein